MKCLAVGMNPNYVLSEDERQKRFRKKKNSGNGNDSLQLEESTENQNLGKSMKPDMHGKAILHKTNSSFQG